MLFSIHCQNAQGLGVRCGYVYLLGAPALPADSFRRFRGLGFDALLSATVGAEPLGLLILDRFV